MNETTMEKPPITPASFFANSLSTIQFVFPDLSSRILTDDHSGVRQDRISENLALLTEKIWQVMEKDLLLKRFGRKKFDQLPQSQQLEILRNALNFLKANKEAEEFFRNGKSQG